MPRLLPQPKIRKPKPLEKTHRIVTGTDDFKQFRVNDRKIVEEFGDEKSFCDPAVEWGKEHSLADVATELNPEWALIARVRLRNDLPAEALLEMTKAITRARPEVIRKAMLYRCMSDEEKAILQAAIPEA